MLFIFDMGGVVTNTAGFNLFEEISKKLEAPLADFVSLMNEFQYSLDVGELSAREFWKIAGERFNKKISADWFRLLFHPNLNMETVRLISDLKKAGHRVVCGTNTIDSHYDNHLSRGDYAFFDMTYASIHMGVRKPDENFWKMILDAENFRAKDTFFTDDKIENVKAAEKLGINSFCFDGAESFRKFIDSRFGTSIC